MNQPNLNAIPLDGRWGLEHSDKKYDLIALDAYQPPYIPWHLTTIEFFQIVKEHLTTNGVVAINVGRAPDDRQLIEVIATTLQKIFPSVYVMDVPESFNSIIYATLMPTSVENLHLNLFDLLDRQDIHPLLTDAMTITALNLQPTLASAMVFTDDLAPVEWITNNMVLKYLLFGDLEVIR
jgi:spermidine synthase